MEQDTNSLLFFIINDISLFLKGDEFLFKICQLFQINLLCCIVVSLFPPIFVAAGTYL